MNYTFNDSSIVSVNSGTIVLNVSGKTRTFVDAKLVSAIDGKIVLDLPKPTTVEKGTYLVVHIILNNAQRTFIAESIKEGYITYYITQYQSGIKSEGVWSDHSCRYATPEEIQELNNQLVSEGKYWNPDTMQIEKLRWKPQYGEYYYRIAFNIGKWATFKIRWIDLPMDINALLENNCFQAKEEAEAKLKQIKQILNSTI